MATYIIDQDLKGYMVLGPCGSIARAVSKDAAMLIVNALNAFDPDNQHEARVASLSVAPYPAGTCPAQRIIIEIEDGLVQRVWSDGIDLSQVIVLRIDRDTEGADPEDLTPFGFEDVWFSPMDILPADDQLSRDVRRAYDTWSLIA